MLSSISKEWVSGKCSTSVLFDDLEAPRLTNWINRSLSTRPRSTGCQFRADVHLTNTSLQRGLQAGASTCIFDDLTEESGLGPGWKKNVFSQICEITSDSFAKAVQCSPTTFQLLSNCFQLFGVDFLVDQTWKVWLLEFNSGSALTYSEVIPDLFDSIVAIVLQRWIKTNDCPVNSVVEVLSL